MISYLNGKIINKGNSFIIIDVGSIGYKVFINSLLYSEINIGDELTIYTYQYVREDSLDLYGFKSSEELEMFELLLSISGIGPKSALGVLAIASIESIKGSIISGDPSLLTKVSGIGKRTAERVVLELREKIGQITDSRPQAEDGSGSIASGDEIDALMALGYSMIQAREALRQVDVGIKDSGERIRQALKGLGR